MIRILAGEEKVSTKTHVLVLLAFTRNVNQRLGGDQPTRLYSAHTGRHILLRLPSERDRICSARRV
jgi:hypothetical protein